MFGELLSNSCLNYLYLFYLFISDAFIFIPLLEITHSLVKYPRAHLTTVMPFVGWVGSFLFFIIFNSFLSFLALEISHAEIRLSQGIS